MSREIKFRIWDSGTKCMHQPALKLLHGEHANNLRRTPGSISTPKNWTWMQYTGLKDKNGIEIYEGDILHWIYEGLLVEATDYRGVVVWWDYGAGFHVNLRNDGDTITPIPHTIEPDGPDGKTLEVIGNIYENPELLKGKS